MIGLSDYVKKNTELFKEYVKIMNQEIDIELKIKIKEKVEEFQEKTGVNKTFIARRLGISKQALSESFKSNNPRLDTLIKFAICLECDIEDLFEYYQKTGFQKKNTDISEK